MTISRLWGFLSVALPTLAALIASLQTVDLTYHLRAGAEILDTGAIPATDSWTFTAFSAPWVDQQWGTQVLFEAVYRLGGWTGLVLLRAVLVAVIFWCLFEIGRRRGLETRASAWLTLGAFLVAAAALALRPQLVGMALFAVVMLLVADRRRHPGRLWAIPLVCVLWANVHGSFFLAPLVLALAWLEDIRDRIGRPHLPLVVGLVSVAAACITPFGPAVWTYAIGLGTNPEVRQRITEWQTTSVTTLIGLLFYGSALLVAVALARRGRTASWVDLAWLGIFFAIGAYAERGVAWWPLGAVVPVASLLASSAPPARAPRAEPWSMRRLNAVVAGAVVLVGVALLPVWRPVDPGTGAPQGALANAPSGITAALREQAAPGQRVFNPQVWGSWFEFAIPSVAVAIDSRIEFFPPDVWAAYDVVRLGRGGWDRQLEQWGVTVAVARNDEHDLISRLVTAGWRQAFTDRDGVILVRPDR